MIDFHVLEKNALAKVAEQSEEIESIALQNTQKVLAAFRNNKVADYYLKASTGYAYNDVGRDSLEKIYAEIFHTEAALVRNQFVSGTHALAVALLGNLRAGEEILGVTGTPYDTMQTVIGSPLVTPGSLVDLGVRYRELPFTGLHVDLNAITSNITAQTKMIYIQRSCGYSSERASIDIQEIASICHTAKAANPQIICFVDNCYGEFVEAKEPTEVGADLTGGSLIKNLGGGLAPTGGYLAGRADLIANAAYRLTAPGLGAEMGASLGDTARCFYQGLFLAPHVVLQAVKTAIFSAAIFHALGYHVKPLPQERRSDIIQAITLSSKEKLCKFCTAIQENSPVDAHVTPVPAPLPGYQDKVIMAAGTFVQGASIELSADGPCREPFNVFLQGGLTFEHGRLAIMKAARLLGANS